MQKNRADCSGPRPREGRKEWFLLKLRYSSKVEWGHVSQLRMDLQLLGHSHVRPFLSAIKAPTQEIRCTFIKEFSVLMKGFVSAVAVTDISVSLMPLVYLHYESSKWGLGG